MEMNKGAPAENVVAGDVVAGDVVAVLPSWQLAVFAFNEEVARSLGIVSSDLHCLFVLDRSLVHSPTEIATLTRLSTGATSRMIERLVRAGLVTRDPDPDDRRRVRVAITAAASAALHRYYDPLDDRLRDLLATAPDGFGAQLVTFSRQAEDVTVGETARLRDEERRQIQERNHIRASQSG